MFDFDVEIDISENYSNAYSYGSTGCWIFGEPDSFFPCKCCTTKDCKEFLKKNKMHKISISQIERMIILAPYIFVPDMK